MSLFTDLTTLANSSIHRGHQYPLTMTRPADTQVTEKLYGPLPSPLCRHSSIHRGPPALLSLGFKIYHGASFTLHAGHTVRRRQGVVRRRKGGGEWRGAGWGGAGTWGGEGRGGVGTLGQKNLKFSSMLVSLSVRVVKHRIAAAHQLLI